MNAKEQFTERLKQAMRVAGLNPNQLAERLSEGQDRVYPSVTTGWYDGGMPKGEYMLRLPGVLGVNGHWLLTGEGDPYATPEESQRQLQQIREMLGFVPRPRPPANGEGRETGNT